MADQHHASQADKRSAEARRSAAAATRPAARTVKVASQRELVMASLIRRPEKR